MNLHSNSTELLPVTLSLSRVLITKYGYIMSNSVMEYLEIIKNEEKRSNNNYFKKNQKKSIIKTIKNLK